MERSATVVWQGDLEHGKGKISTQSGLLNQTEFSFTTRFKNGSGTNPEELVAAAHGGCFTMAVAALLDGEGFKPDELSSKATLTLEQAEGVWTITNLHLDVTGKVPGIDEVKFNEIVDKAKAGYTVSRGPKADITHSKKLIS